MISLKNQQPFARGGNRLCFVDPSDAARCIKVRRPNFTLEDLRKRKGFPHVFFPVSWLDESRKENQILEKYEARLGAEIYKVLPKNYGFVETDMGPGLCSELIRNADGRISLSVMQYVWENGKTDTLLEAVGRFSIDWPPLMLPARDILLHNVVAQFNGDDTIKRLVVIDGLGYSGMIPYGLQPDIYKIRRGQRKVRRFLSLVDELLETKRNGDIKNKFWKQKHDGLRPDLEDNSS